MGAMAHLRIQSGAAQQAALLLVGALLVQSAAPVDAKMRIDQLSIVAADGRKVPLDVEVAQDPKEKALGLMFRTELGDNQGMLFPYDDTRELSMWMHNTYIPLDMVFIRKDGVIHRIEARAEPLSDRVISSEGEVSAVLELAGGAAARLGIKAGDRVQYPLFGPGKP
ncbi:MAG: DUF192 domain-containing protein [Hyphomicrobium sp.]